MADFSKKQLDPRALKGTHFTELGRMLNALITALELLDDGPRSIKDGYFGNYYQASSFKRGDREFEENPIHHKVKEHKDAGPLLPKDYYAIQRR